MEQVLQFHLNRYPKMQPDDLYKLLHQAAMGSEHAIPNREAASQWMDRELDMLQQSGAASPDETLYEPLSPDGRLVRVEPPAAPSIGSRNGASARRLRENRRGILGQTPSPSKATVSERWSWHERIPALLAFRARGPLCDAQAKRVPRRPPLEELRRCVSACLPGRAARPVDREVSIVGARCPGSQKIPTQKGVAPHPFAVRL